MLLKYNASTKEGVRIELHRTSKKGNFIEVKEVVEGETEVTQHIKISCLIAASKYVEAMTLEYEGLGLEFDKSWMKGCKGNEKA